MFIRPTQAIRKLSDPRNGPYSIASKIISLTCLVGHAYLDQADRPRRKPKEGKKRVTKFTSAKQVRANALAHLFDHVQRREPHSRLCKKLARRISRNGGLTVIAEATPSEDLIVALKVNQRDVDYVVAIVDFLVRTKINSEVGILPTIEVAKGFVWKYFEDYSVSQIGCLWEDYKLVAPYLFALWLEKSFRPDKIKGADDIIVWARTFVRNPRRLARLLGHAAFAMDVLSCFARDQRLLDVDGVIRIRPSLPPLGEQDKLIVANLNRDDPDYGRSFHRFD